MVVLNAENSVTKISLYIFVDVDVSWVEITVMNFPFITGPAFRDDIERLDKCIEVVVGVDEVCGDEVVVMVDVVIDKVVDGIDDIVDCDVVTVVVG